MKMIAPTALKTKLVERHAEIDLMKEEAFYNRITNKQKKKKCDNTIATDGKIPGLVILIHT